MRKLVSHNLRNPGKPANTKPVMVSASLALLLSACGGGGGGSSSPSTPPVSVTLPLPELVMTVSETQLSVNELEAAEISVTFDGVQGAASFSAEIDQNGAGVTVDNDVTDIGASLTVTSPELENNQQLSMTLTLSDDEGRTKAAEVEISLNNISAVPVIERLAATHEGLPSFVSLQTETRLFSRIAQLVRMTNSAFNTPEDATVMEVIDTELEATLHERHEEHGDMVQRYENGEVTESSLREYTEQTLSYAFAYVEPVNTLLNDLISNANGLLPALATGEVFVAESYSTLSQFIGNPEMGAYSEQGEWTFSDTYKFIETIAIPGLETCDTE